MLLAGSVPFLQIYPRQHGLILFLIHEPAGTCYERTGTGYESAGTLSRQAGTRSHIAYNCYFVNNQGRDFCQTHRHRHPSRHRELCDNKCQRLGVCEEWFGHQGRSCTGVAIL